MSLNQSKITVKWHTLIQLTPISSLLIFLIRLSWNNLFPSYTAHSQTQTLGTPLPSMPPLSGLSLSVLCFDYSIIILYWKPPFVHLQLVTRLPFSKTIICSHILSRSHPTLILSTKPKCHHFSDDVFLPAAIQLLSSLKCFNDRDHVFFALFLRGGLPWMVVQMVHGGPALKCLTDCFIHEKHLVNNL